MRILSHTRSLALVLAVTFIVYQPNLGASGGADSQLCGNECTYTTECTETCYPTQFDFDHDLNLTTCGEFDGGYWNDMCDGTTAHTCSFECDIDSSPAQNCTYEGVGTTCGSFGIADSCNNGICNTSTEDCDSCSADCGTCTESVTEQEASDWLDVVTAANTAGYLNESIEGLGNFLNLASAAGLIPTDDYSAEDFDGGEPFGMDQCCDAPKTTLRPLAYLFAPLIESPDGSVNNLNGLDVRRENPVGWVAGWYDCASRPARMAKVSKAGWGAAIAATATGIAAAWFTGGASSLLWTASVSSGFGAYSANEINGAISRLPCFNRY